MRELMREGGSKGGRDGGGREGGNHWLRLRLTVVSLQSSTTRTCIKHQDAAALSRAYAIARDIR
jgi:hypothetical protein